MATNMSQMRAVLGTPNHSLMNVGMKPRSKRMRLMIP